MKINIVDPKKALNFHACFLDLFSEFRCSVKKEHIFIFIYFLPTRQTLHNLQIIIINLIILTPRANEKKLLTILTNNIY